MSKLYVIPTPIGNLEDITLRSLGILKSVDFILCEDTRKTSFLLKHYNINKKLISYHKFNEHKILYAIIDKIKSVNSVGLVSDAGTPGISDPGYLLIHECLKNQIEVECLPGPTAFIPALINSGLPTDRFVFEGFLPRKKGRKARIEILKNETRTIIIYEAPQRLLKTIQELILALGENRNASISREISKIHEETIRGTLIDLYNYYSNKIIKGECVLIIGPKN